MKFSEWLMTEMPINSFQLKGNWNGKKYGYSDQDIGILTNPKAVEKIHRKWSNTKENFDLYFLRSPQGYKQSQLGIVNPEQVKEMFNLDITPNPDNITVIFLNNKAADKMPMNSWQIAHRMGHALSIYPKKSEIFDYLAKEIKIDFTEILRDVYHREYNYGNQGQKDKDLQSLGYAILTMKSARDRNQRSFYELIYELLAQYINTGKIKFNPLPKYLISQRKMAWGRPKDSHYRSDHDDEDLEGWDENVQDLAAKYEHIFDDLLGSVRGKILVM